MILPFRHRRADPLAQAMSRAGLLCARIDALIKGCEASREARLAHARAILALPADQTTTDLRHACMRIVIFSDDPAERAEAEDLLNRLRGGRNE